MSEPSRAPNKKTSLGRPSASKPRVASCRVTWPLLPANSMHSVTAARRFAVDGAGSCRRLASHRQLEGRALGDLPSSDLIVMSAQAPFRCDPYAPLFSRRNLSGFEEIGGATLVISSKFSDCLDAL